MKLSGYGSSAYETLLDIKGGIYMSKGLDFLMLEKSNIYTQVSNIIKFFLIHTK